MTTHRGSAGFVDRQLGRSQRYEMLGKLASGGMGTVHLARMRGPLGFSRLVAIKTMHPRHASDPAACAMFLDEAQLTAQLRHPNIVPTLDFVADGGELMLVMDYVEGDTLRALQKASVVHGERCPTAVACAIARDVLLGLHAAHEARDEENRPLGIIHRDVSPDNVIVGLDGVTRVLDFGVAHAKSAAHVDYTGEIRGKVVYMAPEHLAGEEVDRTIDVYSVGAVLWEALTGRRLFRGAATDPALVQRILHARELTPPSASVPLGQISPALDSIILRMLSPDPRGRPRTALAAARELEASMQLASAHEVAKWARRHARPRPMTPDRTQYKRDPNQPIVRNEPELGTMPGVERTINRTANGNSVPPTSDGFRRSFPAPMMVVAAMLVLGCISAAGLGVRASQSMRAASAGQAPAPPPPPPSVVAAGPASTRCR